MTYYPAADPIPLPAPVWLFKVLHDLTFTLHIASVELMLGGLMLAIVFDVLGRVRRDANLIQASGMMAHRLPTVLAFVINLGVPPLLFAQVLYGRALYTSSVLIGAYWISVILLLMASYYGLYFSARRAEQKRGWAAAGLAALFLMLTIAFIYSNNMTLMLRPQVWAEMYRHSPTGVQWNAADPTVWPRWLYFVLGSFGAAGCGLMLLSLRDHFLSPVRTFLFRAGAGAAALGAVAQAALAGPALAAQPHGVVATVMANSVYSACAYVWMAATALLALAALAGAATGAARKPIAIVASLGAFLNIAAMVVVRDGIRDVTLRLTGFEVWDRQVVTNWSVVGIFLALLVGAAVAIGYLIRVVAKARRLEEKYV